MKPFHIIFQTLRREEYFTQEIAKRMTEYIKLRLPTSRVGVINITIQPDHIHLFVTGTHPREEWNHILCNLQKELTNLLHQEFPEQNWPRYLWIFNWHWSVVDSIKYENALNNYIANQKKWKK